MGKPGGRWVEKQGEKWTQLWITEDPALLIKGVLIAPPLSLGLITMLMMKDS